MAENVLLYCGKNQFLVQVDPKAKVFQVPKNLSTDPDSPERSVPAWARGHRFCWFGDFDPLLGLRIFEADV